ncbi:MAG: helix-turn-helix domain-containing protein [Lachnospiraceae bacterium]|nr:helix-turn-helix domain-containing protein [Lachnospiraceae bacterium]
MSRNEMTESKSYEVPIWHKYALTVEEAARYYHIGEGKLRAIIDSNPNGDFYMMNGNRALIKREKFERFLDMATVV